jgi:hypothetical protein
MKNRISKLSILIVLITSIVCLFNQKNYELNEKKKGVIKSDVVSYYAYLPATFVHHDIGLTFLNNPDTLRKYAGSWRFWPKETGTNRKAIKTAMGNSILYSPFFAVAHIIAPWLNYSQDGFSEIYHFAIALSSIFYVFIGLIFVRKTLSRYYNDYLVSLGILLCFFATNLSFYTLQEFGMSHPSSFFLISAFLFYTLKFIDQTSIRLSITLGILSGLITLVRPSNILVALILLIAFLSKHKFTYLIKEWKHWIIMISVGFITISPQLLYWKYVSGNWLFFSYSGERFYFNDPQIFNGLFSYRNGWFTYTPVMIFSLIGIFFLKDKALKTAILFFVPLIIYFTYSWWCWWYGGSYGSRPMIDFYGLLIIPLIAMLDLLWKKGVTFRILGLTLSAFFIFQGIFFVSKRHYQSFHYDSMTKEAYWEHLLDIHSKPAYWDKLKKPDYSKAKIRE